MAPEQRRAESQRDREVMLLELLASERHVFLGQARRNCRIEADAEDALSEAIVQFLRYYGGAPGADAARWMMVVIRNCARQMIRRAAHRQIQVNETLEEAGEVGLPDPGPGPAEVTLQHEEAAAVSRALNSLKPDQRTALLLRGLGYSYAEIEGIQGWSKTKVRRCITEGRAALRDLLEEGGKS